MERKTYLFAALLFIGSMTTVEAQTLRGTVTDAISGEALIGATIKVVEADKGTISDADGNFRIDIPQSGRYTIETTYIGYEPNVMKEVLVAGVKEVVVEIQLRENKSELAEVVVKPRVNKAATVNPTALIGGVMLSMEEASRYAGGYNDPARL
ncbi:MAG: carboxypeptidase-like regulatory domain-containing protein, partial [Prevotella sp.]|nr:carboxypeptidase-like regulatory domain-containing protein [Prevotella sp.]